MKGCVLVLLTVAGSLLVGWLAADTKLADQPDSLGLAPLAHWFFALRYSAMAFGMFWPLVSIVWCFRSRPVVRVERIVCLVVASLMLAVDLYFIVPEFR